MKAIWIAAALAAIAGTQSSVTGQVPKEKPTDVTVQGHIYQPKEMKPDISLLDKLKLPDGFEIAIFDDGLSNTRMLAVGDEKGSRLYVTRRDQGDCLLLRDENGDGRADGDPVTVASGENMHGITLHKGKAYIVTVREVFVADIKPDGTFSDMKKIISDLPDGGQHPNRTLAVSLDEKLYISIGSTCNACKETNKESATIVRANLDGTDREIFATGLRNTIGFGWHPTTDVMWGMDHGIDWLGNDQQHEELNKLEEGNFYGWPYIAGDGLRNPQDNPPPGTTFEDWESSTTLPVLGYKAHSSPLQMDFYTTGTFPKEYHGNAFVAMRGSWNRKPPSGYEVVRIDFDDEGVPQKFEPFITGWLEEHAEGEWSHYGRLAGLAISPDGSAMFLADDKNGVIYRITYRK